MRPPTSSSCKNNIPVISDIDTRSLVRQLRTRGVMRGVLSSMPDAREADLVEKARAVPSMTGLDLATPRIDGEVVQMA